jgi:hypothetical protein
MATEQLATAVYKIAGQPALAGDLAGKYEVIEATYGFEEDSEVKQKQTGQFGADITYSRRETCQLELEALHDTDSEALIVAGELASGILPRADGSTASAWNIRSATLNKTRGVQSVSLDLIMQLDTL